jgi:hypothetical protein
MYRISRDAQETMVVDTFKAINLAIGSNKPGRYVIEEISDATPPTGDNARPWGIGIKWADGSVEIERDPWPASHRERESHSTAAKGFAAIDLRRVERVLMRFRSIAPTFSLLRMALHPCRLWTEDRHFSFQFEQGSRGLTQLAHLRARSIAPSVCHCRTASRLKRSLASMARTCGLSV